MGEVKQMTTPQARYASMARDSLILAKAGVEQRVYELKAKIKALDTKPYQMRTGQDRVTLQRMESDLGRHRSEMNMIAAALSALKERRREQSEAEAARPVSDARERVAATATTATQADVERLKANLEAAEQKLRGAAVAQEFMEVARLVLAESTFGRIKARAHDNLRLKNRSKL